MNDSPFFKASEYLVFGESLLKAKKENLFGYEK